MRVLVTSTPGAGHLHPLVPLASAAHAAGHELLWATAEESCAQIARYGFRAAPAGIGVRERTERFSRRPADASLLPRQRRAELMSGLFGWVAAPRMRRDLAPIVDQFEPDVIISDLAELAAAPVARSREIPHVTVGFSGALSDSVHNAVVESVSPVWKDEGLPAPGIEDLYGELYLHGFPPSLGSPPPIAAAASMRPEHFDGAAVSESPGWAANFGHDRPGAYVTFGTAMGALAPWRALFEALSTVEVDAVVTIGSTVDVSALGPIPDNVRVERYVPQGFLLDRASIVASHGGAGTMLATAERGVPQLCTPVGADQWDNADALAAAGAGITVEMDQRDASTLHDLLGRLLTDQGLHTAARRLASEFAELPHPRELIPRIETLR